MSEFDRLKDLLLADERAERQAQAQAFTEKIAASFADLPQELPDLLRRAQQDDRLARALEKPLAQGLERIARTKKMLLISVLFPLIGPIIRRSIAETMSQLMKDMNRAVEHSISPTGLRWRWEAFRTGVPFTQVVLKHTLRYRVEHLLLVNNDGGLLLAHVANVDAALADSDAVAGMLSALQDFARDAVFAHQDEALKSVEVGGMTLKILRGPLMHLAVAVRGELSEPAQQSLSVLVETLHNEGESADLEAHKAQYRDLIADWMLENGQESSQAIDDARANKPSQPVLLKAVAVLLAASLLYLGGLAAWHRYQAHRFESALSGIPGILASVHFVAGKYQISGSRDPFAKPLMQTAAPLNIAPDSIDESQLRPYLSLDPIIWQRRLQASGQLPKTLTLSQNGSAIKINGEMTGMALAKLRADLILWQTLLDFDFSGIKVNDAETQHQRLEIMRQLALMRVDLSDKYFDNNASLSTLISQCQALLDSAPNQTLQLTAVEYVQSLPPVTSASGLAVANRLRAELKRVKVRLIPAAAKREQVNTLAFSEISLR